MWLPLYCFYVFSEYDVFALRLAPHGEYYTLTTTNKTNHSVPNHKHIESLYKIYINYWLTLLHMALPNDGANL
jgi:hypothetical protein